MKQHIFFLFALFLFCFSAKAETMKSIQEFGVLPQNSPQTNAENLQKAIDWATQSGAALWVEPTEDGYPVASGIVLKENLSLFGVHGPTGSGTGHP